MFREASVTHNSQEVEATQTTTEVCPHNGIFFSLHRDIRVRATPWMDPENIMLSEASQSQEDTRHVRPLIRGTWRTPAHRDRKWDGPSGWEEAGGEGVSPGDSFQVQNEESWRSVRGSAISAVQAASGRRQGLARLGKAGPCAGTLARQQARLSVPGPGNCLHRR